MTVLFALALASSPASPSPTPAWAWAAGSIGLLVLLRLLLLQPVALAALPKLQSLPLLLPLPATVFRQATRPLLVISTFFSSAIILWDL